MREHWQNLLDKAGTEKMEKQTVRGFLKVWGNNSRNEKIAALVADILRQFEALQKEA